MKAWVTIKDKIGQPWGGKRRRSRVQSAGLDAFAERLPSVYTALVVLGALLGYAYLFLFPVLTVLFISRAALYASQLEWLSLTLNALAGIVCLVLSYTATRVRPSTSDLQRLTEAQAPRLFELVEQVRGEQRAPRLNELLIDDSLDARLVRNPRNAYPLFFTYSLFIGLPAMQLLSPLQFKGLVIRRLAQAAGRQHGLLRWLVLWRDVGPALLQACPNWRRAESIVVRLFFPMYSRFYNWLSAPAARMYELRIDNYMMSSINDRDVADLLAAQLIAERYLRERYFPELLKFARKKPNPPPVAYSGLDHLFNRYWSGADAKQWLNQAFTSVPRPGDTRPALAKRLLEIGHTSPRVPSPLRQAASRALLGASLKHTLAKQDGRWMRRVMPQWRTLHQAAKREQQRLRVLFDKSRKERLDLAEARELASLVERCYGKAKAVPLYRQLLANNPGDANVSFAAGRFLLSVGDAQGVEALQRAMRLDPRFLDPATNLIESYQAHRRSVPIDTGDTGNTNEQIIVKEVSKFSELN